MKAPLILCAVLLAGPVAAQSPPAQNAPAQSQSSPGPVGFSSTAQPTSFAVQGSAYVLNGYRRARWGMTPAEVRVAVARDFPDADIGEDVEDPVTHTTLFVVAVPHLSPGPGPAAVTYIFGATTGKLMHVNVDWRIAEPNANDRAAMMVAGSRVVADYLGYYWKLLSVARGAPVGPNSLLLFGAQGEAGGAVEVRLEGVRYVMKTAKGDVVSQPPSGPVVLQISLAPTSAPPDIYAIKPGEF